jgi:tRNA(Ile)-lysidine synthase
LERVADALHPVVLPDRSILLGLSGGMDSVVLLHLLHTLAPRFSWRISALHVHHGISPNADAWADFCTVLCSRYAIPLHIEHVNIAPLRDEHGIEAAARQLRHAAFAKQDGDFIALAHHADDQAETLLLQLLRGAGLRGVAAMPTLKPASTHSPATLRPLLNIPRSVLLAYAQQHELPWVEDESNADDYYPRNFLRQNVLPELEKKFPAYRGTLSRSARHFAEAGELLDELAQQDARGWSSGEPLDIALLRSLSLARAKNLLRYFLHTCGAPMPQAAQLDDMLQQLIDAREDSAVCVEFGCWQVRYYQNKVYVLRALGEFDQDFELSWQGENELAWPASNITLFFTPASGQGISLNKLQRAPLTLRLRRGGESLRPHPKAATRSLKNLLQEQHIPPWQRERLPLLFCGDELVCVIGVAIAADYCAAAGENSLLVSET